jgi:hypothetical protein
MTESKATIAPNMPVITKVVVDFCDPQLRPGIRSDVRRNIVMLKDLPQAFHNYLMKDNDGKIVHWGSYPGAADPNTGQLFTRSPDHYNGKAIVLRKHDNTKGTKFNVPGAKGESVKIPVSDSSPDDAANISEYTGWILIKTFLRGQTYPEVELHRCDRTRAVFESPGYGSATIEIKGSKYWGSIDMTFAMPDSDYQNYIDTTRFNYLITREGPKLQFAPGMFEGEYAYSAGGLNVGKIDAKTAESNVEAHVRAEKEHTERLKKQPPSDEELAVLHEALIKQVSQDKIEDEVTA